MPLKVYNFGEFCLDLNQKELTKNGEPVPIQPRAFDVLAALVEQNNRVISRDDLMQAVWGDTFVEETNLRYSIHSLRKILGGDFIETLPKRGYRFNGKVTVLNEDTAKESLSLPDEQQIELRKPFLPRWALASVAIITAIVSVGFAARWLKSEPQKPSIAVLPFTQVEENTKANIALTDAVISQLSKLKDHQVLPVTAVEQYSSGNIDPIAAGKELGSDSVLSGSIRREGENVTVNASLRRVSDGETVWAETFNVKPDEYLGLEKSVSLRLARLLSNKIVEHEDEKAAKKSQRNPAAINAYVSARKIWRSRDLGRVAEMNTLLDEAIKLEPGWVEAHSAKAEALIVRDFASTSYADAETAAKKTLELNPADPGALSVLARIEWEQNWNFDKAEEYLKAAIKSNPNYANAHSEYGILLALKKSSEQGEQSIKKALELEPFSPMFQTHLCQSYYYDKYSRDINPDAAMGQCKIAMQMEPEFWLARKQLFWIFVTRKMNGEVAKMILSPYSEEARQKLPFYPALKENNLSVFWKTKIAERSKSPNHFADSMMHIQISDTQSAIESLSKSIEEKDFLISTINVDPAFDPIREEPGFQEIVKKLAVSDRGLK